jgi:hypothetical protein
MISVQVIPEFAALAHPNPERITASTPPLTQKFTAVVLDDPSNLGVKWSVAQGAGQIDSMGVFHAPEFHGKATIKATSVADATQTATAIVTYNCPPGCKHSKV